MLGISKNSLAVISVAALVLVSGSAGADAFRGAVGAGLLGAGIGGIAGGGSGAAKGAAIGAGVGLLAGGAQQNKREQQQREQQMRQQQEAEAARLRAEQERLALERQRLEMEQQMQRERMMMQQQQQQQFAAPAPAPLQLQAADPALIADIQRSLTILGFQPGPIDGLLGAQTVVAIKNYETANGLLVTGQPSHPLLQHMRARGG